jgi:hypothetical protein
MRTLWRTTAYLFWQHPILWLPVVLADLIAFCLRTLQDWMTHAVIYSLVAGHSVLSSSPEPVQTLPVVWSVIFAASKLLVELLNAYLYAAAMVAISILIPALIAQTRIPWREIPFAIRQRRVQILLLRLKVFGMLIVAASLGAALIVYLPRLHFLPPLFAIESHSESYAIEAVVLAAIAWILAPSAVALLRPREAPPTNAQSMRHARILAAISVSATAALYYLATFLRPSFAPELTTPLAINAFWLIASVASALPYIPLFIALYLIANPDNPLAIPPMVDPTPDNLPSDTIVIDHTETPSAN